MSENTTAPATGGATDTGGAEATYDGDIAAMQAQIAHTDETVLPHLEMLRSQAEAAENGPGVLAAIDQASESAAAARDAAQAALDAVRTANESVRTAYADSGNEAAKQKSYFQGG